MTASPREIHKIAAVAIKDNCFLMVKKLGKEIWTSLGGHPETGETEEQALLREIEEELTVPARIIRKLGDFRAPAAHDDAVVVLSTYLVELEGDLPDHLPDPELETARYLSSDYAEKGVRLPASITGQVLPYCIKEGLLDW